MYLIKIFQSIICHQLTRFFSNKNSINHKNPSSCDKTNKTHQPCSYHGDIPSPVFSSFAPPQNGFGFTKVQLHQCAAGLVASTVERDQPGCLGFCWMIHEILCQIAIFHQPGKFLKFSGISPSKKLPFLGAEVAFFCLTRLYFLFATKQTTTRNRIHAG